MLYADKRALQTNLKVSLLAIRERELTFYTNNSLAIGTQAAMFAGFAFAGLTQPLPEETSVLRALFLVCNVSALGADPPFTATFARLSPQLLPLSARRALSPRSSIVASAASSQSACITSYSACALTCAGAQRDGETGETCRPLAT